MYVHQTYTATSSIKDIQACIFLFYFPRAQNHVIQLHTIQVYSVVHAICTKRNRNPKKKKKKKCTHTHTHKNYNRFANI